MAGFGQRLLAVAPTAEVSALAVVRDRPDTTIRGVVSRSPVAWCDWLTVRLGVSRWLVRPAIWSGLRPVPVRRWWPLRAAVVGRHFFVRLAGLSVGTTTPGLCLCVRWAQHHHGSQCRCEQSELHCNLRPCSRSWVVVCSSASSQGSLSRGRAPREPNRTQDLPDQSFSRVSSRYGVRVIGCDEGDAAIFQYRYDQLSTTHYNILPARRKAGICSLHPLLTVHSGWNPHHA